MENGRGIEGSGLGDYALSMLSLLLPIDIKVYVVELSLTLHNRELEDVLFTEVL